MLSSTTTPPPTDATPSISSSAPSATTLPVITESSVARAHIAKTRAFTAATELRCKKKIVSFVRYHLEKKKKITKPTTVPSTPPSSPLVRDRDVPAAAALAAQALMSMAASDIAPSSTMDVPPNASLLDFAELASRHVWHVEKMRDVQRDCIEFIYNPLKKKRAFIVLPTAFGKSHVIRLVGTMSKGIHLIIHPLLALTADQVAAFGGGRRSLWIYRRDQP